MAVPASGSLSGSIGPVEFADDCAGQITDLFDCYVSLLS